MCVSNCNIKCKVVLGRNLLPFFVEVFVFLSLNINFELLQRDNSLRFDFDTGQVSGRML